MINDKHMDVSLNGGTPRDIIHFGIFHYKPSGLGYPHGHPQPPRGKLHGYDQILHEPRKRLDPVAADGFCSIQKFHDGLGMLLGLRVYHIICQYVCIYIYYHVIINICHIAFAKPNNRSLNTGNPEGSTVSPTTCQKKKLFYLLEDPCVYIYRVVYIYREKDKFM